MFENSCSTPSWESAFEDREVSYNPWNSVSNLGCNENTQAEVPPPEEQNEEGDTNEEPSKKDSDDKDDKGNQERTPRGDRFELHEETGQTLAKEKGREAVVGKKIIKIEFARPGHYVGVGSKSQRSKISKAVSSISEAIRGSKDEEDKDAIRVKDHVMRDHFAYFCLSGENLSIQANDVILQMVSYGLASLELKADAISFSTENAPNGYSIANINLSWIHKQFSWNHFGLDEGSLKNNYKASPTLGVEVGINVSFPNLNPGDKIVVINFNTDSLESGKRARITNSLTKNGKSNTKIGVKPYGVGVGVEVESSRSQRTEIQYADGVAARFKRSVHAHSADFEVKIGSEVRQDPSHEIFHVQQIEGNIDMEILVPTDGVEQNLLKMICTIQGQVVSGTWCKQGIFARANANAKEIVGASIRRVTDAIHGVHRTAEVMVRNLEAPNGYCYQDIHDSPERTSVLKSIVCQVSHIKKPE